VKKESCPNCNKEFKSYHSKGAHQSHCNNKTKVLCNICNKEYSVHGIKKHISSHKKDKPCICCGTITNNPKYCSSSCSAIIENPKKKKQVYCLWCDNVLISSAKKYCSRHCQNNYKYETYIIKWKTGLVSGNIGQEGISNYIRKYLFEKHHDKCTKCGWSEIHTITKLIPLQVEHIDGNCHNNKEENLDLLCPNCHSLTPTYGSLNKGKSKRNYRQQWRKIQKGLVI